MYLELDILELVGLVGAWFTFKWFFRLVFIATIQKVIQKGAEEWKQKSSNVNTAEQKPTQKANYSTQVGN